MTQIVEFSAMDNDEAMEDITELSEPVQDLPSKESEETEALRLAEHAPFVLQQPSITGSFNNLNVSKLHFYFLTLLLTIV